MTKPTTTKAADMAKGSRSGPKQDPDPKNSHLIVPALNLGPDDEDEEDDYQPPRGFALPTSPKAASVPSQHGVITGESGPSEAGETERLSVVATAADSGVRVVVAESSPAVGTVPGPQSPVAPVLDSVVERQKEQAPDDHHSGQDRKESSTPISPLDNGEPAEPPSGGALERSSGATSWGRNGATPAVRATGSLAGVPARRPGRRRPTEPFNPDQPRQRNQEAMLELAQTAPNYASLLTVYSASKLNALPFENRNINLYGLTADQVGTQSAADKALIKTLTLQRPKLTTATYVDAALEPVLRPLDPKGVDLDAMEDERDYVYELAQKGLAYRRYILSDPESANMPNYRPVCSLRADVNARLTRMMDLMESIQGIQAKPFEIISACLAEYLASLPAERPHLAGWFQKNLVTTIQ
ncbi:hypothetical protein ACFRMQ_11075 [Kitasatospora sp. NPDC056783]|uniref:hypothetical protein n=1 Tax=Kitasatospora sp. NPDC056783 TaxID=3345943 RepID=UPI003680CC97